MKCKYVVLLFTFVMTACAPPAYLLAEPSQTPSYESSPELPQSTKVQEPMTDTPQPLKTPRNTHVTNCDFLTIRKTPGITGTAIGYIPVRAEVEIMSTCDGDGWRMVRYGNLTGWVNADYLVIGCL